MQNKMKKSAFTMVEAMTSLLIVSAIGMAAMHFVLSYLKTTHDRDLQMNAFVSNLSIAESLRAGVKTLPRLYEFSKDKKMKITAVGIGEIELLPDGSFIVTEPEGFVFSDSLKPESARLFRIEIGGDIPNSKLTTVVILN